MKKILFIRPIFSFFPCVQKLKKKIKKQRTYRPIFHNSILIRKMRKNDKCCEQFSIFPFFLINRKTLKRHTLSDSLLFFYFVEKWRRKEKKNLIRINFRLTNLARRFTQGRWRGGGIFWGGGGVQFSRCGRSSIRF